MPRKKKTTHCEECSQKYKCYGLLTERKDRWCGACAKTKHPGAVHRRNYTAEKGRRFDSDAAAKAAAGVIKTSEAGLLTQAVPGVPTGPPRTPPRTPWILSMI